MKKIIDRLIWEWYVFSHYVSLYDGKMAFNIFGLMLQWYYVCGLLRIDYINFVLTLVEIRCYGLEDFTSGVYF